MTRLTDSAKVILAGGALLALAAASFVLSEIDLGAGRVPVALAIAAVKAALVGFAFMELRREGGTVRLTIAAGVFMLVLMVGLASADVLTR